jgi:archaemetzincin
VFATCALSALLLVPAAPAEVSVALQPLGKVDRAALASVARSLEAALPVRVTVLAERPLPPSAFYAPRSRYRAEALVEFLEHTAPCDVPYVLGVTAQDISVTKGPVADWGVFGVARLAGRAGVVSTRRLKAGGASNAHALERLGRVAAHELAHALGLRHCTAAGCLMNDAEGSVRSVDDAAGFCPRCLETLTALGF